MNLSAELWQANQPLVQECLQSAFVQGIAQGSLPRAQFAYYIGQDAFFLDAFSRAYSVAAAKTRDRQGFETFHALAGGVLQELRLHEGYAASWGINLNQVEPGAATRRYTDFLLATAWGQEVGLIAVAMSPCMRLYAFLGQELARSGIPDHSYADWIRTYSSPEFESLAHELETLANQYTPPLEAARATYRYAMLCERDFFYAAWEEGKSKKDEG